MGYAHALRADARCGRLGERIEHLLSELDKPGKADEARRLANERRTIEESARRLRGRLADVRSLFARWSARSDSA